MCEELEAANIPCTLILDSAMGYVMEQVDMVMVGAEGVVESGGIINKVSLKDEHSRQEHNNCSVDCYLLCFYLFTAGG